MERSGDPPVSLLKAICQTFITEISAEPMVTAKVSDRIRIIARAVSSRLNLMRKRSVVKFSVSQFILTESHIYRQVKEPR